MRAFSPSFFGPRLLLALSLLLAAPAYARPHPAAPGAELAHPLPPDRTTALPARRPDAARLRELAAQREFQYATAADDAAGSAWSAFWARLGRWLGQLLGTPAGRATWDYGVYAALVAALVFVVLKLLQVDLTGAFGRSARRGALGYDTQAENIHDVDFPARIAEAEAAGNFRLATRLGYLEVLKQLTDRGLMAWQPDKTNHAYLAELPAGPLREAFRCATHEFEYVWYGELRLSAGLYQQARASQRALTSGPLAGGRGPRAGAAIFPTSRPA